MRASRRSRWFFNFFFQLNCADMCASLGELACDL